MSHFYSYLSRMKLIQRWALMRNIQTENVQEHSLQVAMIAHALAVIKNKFYNGNVNTEKVALLGVYHDASEVLTGDLPTPVKYFNSEIKEAYKSIEEHASKKLISMLPEELVADFSDILFSEDKEAMGLVKQADTLCAYIKCLHEEGAGNTEFRQAKKIIHQKLQETKTQEVQYFMDNFLDSFSLSLDEMR